jgi:PilZ domain-containing protein
MSLNKIAENRKLERLILRIKVFDNDTGSFLGHTEDIHTEGMMLISEERVALDKDICLRLEHVKDNFEKTTILLTANGVWSKTAHESEVFNTGYRFVDTSHTQTIELNNLFQELTLDTTP